MEDLFRSRLKNIIDLRHELVRLGAAIDWRFFDDAFDAFYSEDGRPGIATRMMVGLHILKHMFDLSDEEVCERWVYDPYFQYFCGEAYFQHALPIDRSSMTRWRDRIGPEGLEKVFQESLGVAHRTGALRAKDLKRVTVDTTVQEKAVAFPTDAKLIHRARERLVRLSREHGVPLRQSYARVGKRALIMQGRYRHAKQHKRANRAMRKLKTYLGRTLRDIRRPPPLVAGRAGADPEAPRSLPQGLFTARPGGRVHRKGQGTQALRIRLQSQRRDDQRQSPGRPVRHPYEGLP
jgi:IS5 family transposase